MKAKILIIEDEHAILKMYQMSFDKEEIFEPYYAENGDIGLQKALEIKPDIILLDVMMPGMNGYEVLEALRNNTSMDVYIIMFTNLNQDVDREKGLALGVDEYFVKSNYTPKQVVEKVKEIIHKKKTEVGAHYTLNFNLAETEENYDLMTELGVKTLVCDRCNQVAELRLFKRNIPEDHLSHPRFQADFYCPKCDKKIT